MPKMCKKFQIFEYISITDKHYTFLQGDLKSLQVSAKWLWTKILHVKVSDIFQVNACLYEDRTALNTLIQAA